jgi:acetyl-CoA synthetase
VCHSSHLKRGFEPSADLARDLFRFLRARLGPYKGIRRIEFSELPKAISGKIRRVQLRGLELQPSEGRRPAEDWEDDFPEMGRGELN